MTSNPDALLPSAKEVMQKISFAEAEEAEKQARMRADWITQKITQSLSNDRSLASS